MAWKDRRNLWALVRIDMDEFYTQPPSPTQQLLCRSDNFCAGDNFCEGANFRAGTNFCAGASHTKVDKVPHENGQPFENELLLVARYARLGWLWKMW